MSNQQKGILLTGATGFLGSHLLEALLKKGYKIVILKRSFSNTWRIEHLLSRVKSYDVDKQEIKHAFLDQHINIVIHTACVYGRNGESISNIVESNIMFGLRVLEKAILYNVDAFLNTDTFFNTDTLTQKYMNAYSLTKKQFVEWLQQQSEKIQIVNMKLEHMYGPKDDSSKFVPWFISQLMEEVDTIKLTAGEQERDFIYVDDVVSAYMIILKKHEDLPNYKEFKIGSGQPIKLKDFITTIVNVYREKYGGMHTKIDFGKIPYREGEIMERRIDNTEIVSLGWKPFSTIENSLFTVMNDIYNTLEKNR